MLKPVYVTLLVLLCVFSQASRVVAEDMPQTLEFRIASESPVEGWQKMKVRGSDRPIFVSNDVSLDGSDVRKVSFYSRPQGDPVMGLEFTDNGAKKMESITSQNHGKLLTIMLNGKVVSAPIIRATISQEAKISGAFDNDDLLAFFHAIVLREQP